MNEGPASDSFLFSLFDSIAPSLVSFKLYVIFTSGGLLFCMCKAS